MFWRNRHPDASDSTGQLQHAVMLVLCYALGIRSHLRRAIMRLMLLMESLGLPVIAIPNIKRKSRRPSHITHGGNAGSTVTSRAACMV